MKRDLLITIAAQGIVSGILCALGSYVALQVTENNVSWIEHIQTNHELRIEALEARAFRADDRIGLLYESQDRGLSEKTLVHNSQCVKPFSSIDIKH